MKKFDCLKVLTSKEQGNYFGHDEKAMKVSAIKIIIDNKLSRAMFEIVLEPVSAL